MSTAWHAHALAGAPAGEVTPPRWDDVWGEPLPPHPGRAWKTQTGRRIGSQAIPALYVHDDHHVLVGHGDWDANDGSTLLVALDPATGTYATTGPHSTEAFHAFRPTSWGETLALFVDGTGYWEPMHPFTTWPERPVGELNALHVFDAAEHEGRLWVAGSALDANGRGVASTWWSVDRGTSWAQSVVTGTPGDYERAYHLHVDDAGRLLAGLDSVADPRRASASWYAWNGASWDRVSWTPPAPAEPQPPYPVPATPHALARTSTHWVLGTASGDIYTRPA